MGLASGIPYLLVNDAITAWLADVKVDITSIGLLALCTLPYGLKFLWAPLLDAVRAPITGRLGRRRGWLVLAMVACVALTMLIAWRTPPTREAVLALAEQGALRPILLSVAIATLALAFCSATLDVVVDAYRADSVDAQSLGRGASLYVAGWRAAVILAGSAVLILPDRLGWPLSYGLMGLVLLVPLVATLWATEPTRGGAPGSLKPGSLKPRSFKQDVLLPITNLIERFRWRTIALIIFVLVYRLPDLFPGRMVMPFLMNEVHFTKDEIGLLRQFGGAVVTIAGALLGGSLIARWGVARCLLLFGILQAASNAGYLLLWWSGHSIPAFIAAIAIENFCNGLVASVFVAYLMSLCDARVSATQYALFTGLMFGAASIAASPSGYVVESLGWGGFFAVSVALGLPGILMIPLVARLPSTTAASTATTASADTP